MTVDSRARIGMRGRQVCNLFERDGACALRCPVLPPDGPALWLKVRHLLVPFDFEPWLCVNGMQLFP
eukprot:CAMPEP_0115874522 /NCGR_PEP_ID=MMETSP0287-20121206/24583_1 /TAXON_ID=412157 /ORGANISM="Chrysochromulina rotalis, Strain UIO044" /LENGTH=66 /DNA_ID=CAMNT_0003329673 /DNA_START=279 /DNA_END=479 /DNA_ORIENTATION=-